MLLTLNIFDIPKKLILSDLCAIIIKMRIAIFGGTFNPVHAEHKNIVNSAINELKLDKVIIVPTFLSPHKTLIPASAKHRLNMLELAFKDADKVEISDYEIKKGGTSYSFMTAEHFRALYPDDELFLLVGGDMLNDFKTWKNPERILSAVSLAVIGREGVFTDYKAEEKYFKKNYGKDFIKLSVKGKTISSAEIRIYLAFGIEPDGLIPEIKEYIFNNGVYPPDKYVKFLKENLTENRLKHTADVAATAMKKAKELSLDQNKVLTAALLHDCAKYLNPADYKGFILPKNVPQPVVHQYLGAYVAENVLGVKDDEVLDAIRYHTSGKAGMATLSKLIFVADMVEKGRNYNGVDKLRALYEKDFEKCFITCLKEEVIHLKNRGGEIYNLTLAAYDYYVKEEKI